MIGQLCELFLNPGSSFCGRWLVEFGVEVLDSHGWKDDCGTCCFDGCKRCVSHVEVVDREEAFGVGRRSW